VDVLLLLTTTLAHDQAAAESFVLSTINNASEMMTNYPDTDLI